MLDELAKVAAEAMARGEDGMKAVEDMGVPTSIAAEAWVIADRAEAKRWWQRVERTIDGEVIRKAIGGKA
ncbi:hypothetical protein [Aurantimonas aggregata]|uniref:hypothetical protein n=1 Tax=Aurantimonas aggregata TaxID=2047720 RepID=UPI001943A032|nr:hypothetical protein [Aurantimonas aggregata]